jgi:hypothetical protein
MNMTAVFNRPKIGSTELAAWELQGRIGRRKFIQRATKLGISAVLLGKIARATDALGQSVVDSLLGAGTTTFQEVSGVAGISPRPSVTFGSPNWGDLNNDGFLDLIVPVAGWLPSIYINNGNGTFTQSFTSGIVYDPAEYHDWHGQAFGDVDNDGCIDVYQTNGAERGHLVGAKTDSLFKGLGNGTFINITRSAGTQNAFGRGRSAFWVDYDNDGLLDIFVKNIETNNVLYHNNGDGTFTDKAASAGLADLLDGWVISFADYDGDGYMDLVISGMTCRLLHNERDGTFRDVTDAAGIEQLLRAEGVAWGDYNKDGYLDLFVTCGATEVVPPGALTPVLYRNNGDGTFTDVTASAGLNVDTNSYSAVWGDFDNDGYLDLFVAAIGFGNGPNANRLYHNNGDGTFTDVAESVGLQLNDGVSPHLGASWGDYDNDGFLDLVIKDGLAYRIKGQARLFHNSGNSNHFLKVALIGTKSNRLGIGAKAYVVTHGRQTLFREHNGGGGGEFRSQGQQPLHFGLGAVASAVSLTVHWPSGHIDTFTHVPGDSLVTVTENSPVLHIRRLRS